MNARKLFAFFVITVLATNVFYPFSVGASDKEEVVAEAENDKTHEPHSEDKHNDDKHDDDKKPQEQSSNQNNSNAHNDSEHKQDHSDQSNSSIQIAQTDPDEGDNRHPSGKDRSEEPGNSKDQGKSQSDPDGKENANGGFSGKDKLGYDGGFDKGDQDGNNGCGNDDDFEDDNNGNCRGKDNVFPANDPKVDHPGKNPGGCDRNGSTGDKNGRPCDPGKNNASEQGCKHGEPDCDRKGGTGGKNDDPKKQDEKKEKNEPSSNTNINIAVNISNQVNNQQSTQPPTQVLAASTLAATGDSLFRLGIALLFMGVASFIFGLFFLGKRAFDKVFNSSFQPYLYVYEA